MRMSKSQSGTAIIEFALSFVVFWIAFIAVIEFGRLMFAWNTASEATRIAARLASICDMGPGQQGRIRDRVSHFIEASGQVSVDGRTDWLTLGYQPAGCDASNCQYVEAQLSNLHPRLMIPFVSPTVTLPSNRIRVPRESMRNSIATEDNDACG